MRKCALVFLILLLSSLNCNLPEMSDSSVTSDSPSTPTPTPRAHESTAQIDSSPKEGPAIDYEMRFGIGGYLYPDIRQGEEAILHATRALDQLGLVWLRHPGRGIAWYEVQPTRDTWDFSKLDAVVEDNRHPWLFPTYGMVGNVYPFGGDFSPESMKSFGDKQTTISYIVEHEIDLNDPQQRADAETYITTLVERYKDRIQYWEIGGNEGISSPHRLEIITYTYDWIKQADPEAVVLITAICGDDDEKFYSGLSALDALLAAGAGDSFDVANFHYYGRIEGAFEARLQTRFNEYKAMLDKHGVHKPIWVTETSTSSYGESTLSGASSQSLQARHVIIRAVVFAAAGAEKIFWYDYGELGPDDLFYGCSLMDTTDGPKPAYYTFKLLVEKLGHYEAAEALRSENVYLYSFIVEGDRKILVAWSQTGLSLDLRPILASEQALVTHISEDEASEPLAETVSAAEVPISPSPIFIEAP